MYRTTPNDTQFGGAWFTIEAVYQRTVAELEAKGSVFWLAFVPLAHDVNEEKLRKVIEGLQTKVRGDDFDELIAAMLSMAKLKKDSQRWMDVIRSAAAKEEPMHPFVRDALDRGVEQGLQQGLQRGRAESVEVLVRILAWRLGRPITIGERRKISKRMNENGPQALGDVIVNLYPEQLAAWLAPRKTSKRKA